MCAFMRAHARALRLVALCRVLGVQRSGYYAWFRHGASAFLRIRTEATPVCNEPPPSAQFMQPQRLRCVLSVERFAQKAFSTRGAVVALTQHPPASAACVQLQQMLQPASQRW